MKRLLTLLILLTAILGTELKAQNRDHKWSIGAGVSVVDFSGPMTKEFFEFDQFKGIGRVYFSRYLNSSLNAKLDYNFGKVWAPVVDPVNGYPNTLEGIYESQFMHAASLTLEYKFDNGYIFRVVAWRAKLEVFSEAFLAPLHHIAKHVKQTIVIRITLVYSQNNRLFSHLYLDH